MQGRAQPAGKRWMSLMVPPAFATRCTRPAVCINKVLREYEEERSSRAKSEQVGSRARWQACNWAVGGRRQLKLPPVSTHLQNPAIGANHLYAIGSCVIELDPAPYTCGERPFRLHDELAAEAHRGACMLAAEGIAGQGLTLFESQC
jgi:hypothetical protein